MARAIPADAPDGRQHTATTKVSRVARAIPGCLGRTKRPCELMPCATFQDQVLVTFWPPGGPRGLFRGSERSRREVSRTSSLVTFRLFAPGRRDGVENRGSVVTPRLLRGANCLQCVVHAKWLECLEAIPGCRSDCYAQLFSGELDRAVACGKGAGGGRGQGGFRLP